MNNTINNVSNISFNARYLDIKKMENLPPRMYEAIIKNNAIDEYIKAGEPKTFIGKLLDLFKNNEIISVCHEVLKSESKDPYELTEMLFFTVKGNKRPLCGSLLAAQNGILRKSGSIPKKGENPLYKPPLETAENQLIRLLDGIKDFEKFLK